MKTAFLFLAEGFEEIEAVTTIDLLRRAGVAVITVAVGNSLEVTGAHFVSLIANTSLAAIDPKEGDAFILPGGLPGVTNLAASQRLKELLLEASSEGKLLGAICAAPSILGELGLLKGKRATCYPSFEPQLIGYTPTEEAVVVEGKIVTARSAGVTIEFALALITELLGAKEADEVASAIIYER